MKGICPTSEKHSLSTPLSLVTVLPEEIGLSPSALAPLCGPAAALELTQCLQGHQGEIFTSQGDSVGTKL